MYVKIAVNLAVCNEIGEMMEEKDEQYMDPNDKNVLAAKKTHKEEINVEAEIEPFMSCLSYL